MRMYKFTVMLGLALLLGFGLATDVGAAALDYDVELSEEERYEPAYYQPLGKGASVGKSADLERLEEILLEGFQHLEKQIDIAECRIPLNAVQTCVLQVLNSHAELFYVDSSFRYGTMDGAYASVIEPNYNLFVGAGQIEEALKEIDAVADEAVALVTDDMEDYEKALVIHDWLAVRCEYDQERFLSGTVPAESHTIYGPFINKVAVCDGYAKAYQYILEKLGIPCSLVTSEEMGHAWNMVEIDGQHYHVDVTWDDPAWDVIGRVMHDNFLLSDQGIGAATEEEKETKHYGWVSEYEAADASFEDALWRRTTGSIAYHEGAWHYIDNKSRKLLETDDLLGGEIKELFALDSWKSGMGTWEGAFSYLQLHVDRLIFNGPKEIYCMPFETKEAFTLLGSENIGISENSFSSLYGMKLENGTLFYYVGESPNVGRDLHDEIMRVQGELPTFLLPGKAVLEGEMKEGGVLTATLELEDDFPENQRMFYYYWYRNGERILDADLFSGEYQLTKEDNGAAIMVKAVHPVYCGVLTAEKTFGAGATDPDDPTKPEKPGDPDDPTKPEKPGDPDVCEHNWTEGVEYKAPTCAKPGKNEWICLKCGEKKEEVIPALEHKSLRVRFQQAPTCAKPGSTGETFCMDCGKTVQAAKEIAATGKHAWDAGEVTEAPTFEHTGKKVFTCKTCRTTKAETLPKATPKKGDKAPYGGGIYKITKAGAKGGTAQFLGTAKKSQTVKILPSIKIGGVTYKVTSIGEGALKNNKSVRKAVIGSNVISIGKNAFLGCKNLKEIEIKSKKLVSVAKNAIKNIHKNASIKCPGKQRKAYEKLFTGKTGYKNTMQMK